MKRNTMNRLFDNMDTLPESLEKIDENTVYAQTGINYDNIENAVKTELGLKRAKKHLGKRFVMTLIAATLTVGILSTSVIAAMGSLKSAFGDVFSGDLNASHLYNGGNVQIRTYDDNLNVELLGVSGDDDTAYAAIQLTKKDGTSFIQRENSLLGIPSETSFGETDGEYPYMNYQNYHIFEEDKLIISTEKTLLQMINKISSGVGAYTEMNGWEFLTDSDTYDENKSVKIIAADGGKTIKMYIKIINHRTSPKGRNVTVSCKELSEYVPVRLLKSFDKVDDKTDEYIQLNYGKNKIDGCFIYNSDNNQYDYWQVNNTKISLPFEVSFKMNYKSDVKTFELDEQTAGTLYFMQDSNDNAVVTVSSFGISIKSYQPEWVLPLFDGKNTKITMKDGTVYRVITTIEKHFDNYDLTSLEYRKDEGMIDFENMDYIGYYNMGRAFVARDIDIIDINSIDTLQINDCIIKVNS